MRTPLCMILCACMMMSSAMMKVISGDICLYTCSNSRITGWIFLKFFVDIVSFEAYPKIVLFNFL
jgi:hypothetical protein